MKTCGLFVDKDLPFLGASTGGLVEDNKIVSRQKTSKISIKFKIN